MRARVLSFIAVCIVIVIVAFLVMSRDDRSLRERESTVSGEISEPATPTVPVVPAPPLPALSAKGLSLATASGPQSPVRMPPSGTALAPPGSGGSAAQASEPFRTAIRTAPGVPPLPVVGNAPPVMKDGASAASPEEAAIEADKVALSLRDYRTILGENPVGTNAEITKALDGGNSKQARLLHEGLTLNRDGELVDRWGTPYFFHQLSNDNMEIRSAGPDRKMWTDDDTVSN